MKVTLRKFLILFVIMMSGPLFAQIEPPSEPTIRLGADTLAVFATYNTVEFDALGKWIAYGATLEPAINVYKLARNNTYKVSHNVVVNGDLNIVADKPDAANAPPYIVAATDLDNAFPSDLIEVNGNLTAKNLYFMGQDIEAQVIGEGADAEFGLRNTLPGAESLVDGCYFEWLRGGILVAGDMENGSNITFTNNLVMNNKNAGTGKWANWWGWSILGGGHDGTVIMRNNTYMNTPGPFYHNWKLNEESMIVEHNTIINNSIYTFFNTEWSNHTIKNNLFLNAQSEGIERQNLNWDPQYSQGIIYVDSLKRYGLDSLYAVKHGIDRADVESHRKVTLKNNYVGWEDWVLDYWASLPDSVAGASHWMNPRVQAMFDDDESFPFFIEENTYTMAEHGAPQLMGGYGGEKTADLFRDYMEKVLTGEDVVPARYYYTPGEPDPQPNPGLVWPLQLDLRVGNAALVGDDGKPVGDLNWYPEYAERWHPDALVSSVEKVNDLLPNEFTLKQNYPNPFNPVTKIDFSLKKSSQINLSIYNVLGQKVRTLIDRNMVSGAHFAQWNGRDDSGNKMASGIYVYRLESDSFSAQKKMILLK